VIRYWTIFDIGLYACKKPKAAIFHCLVLGNKRGYECAMPFVELLCVVEIIRAAVPSGDCQLSLVPLPDWIDIKKTCNQHVYLTTVPTLQSFDLPIALSCTSCLIGEYSPNDIPHLHMHSKIWIEYANKRRHFMLRRQGKRLRTRSRLANE
jgi:hypothetical protein